MNPREAAEYIGMSSTQIRQACRKGMIRAKKKKLNNGDPNAYEWSISTKEAQRYKDNRPRTGPKKKED